MAILSLAHQIEKPWNNRHFCPCPLTPKILVHRIKAISQVSFGSHVQTQFFIFPVFTCFLQPKKITFGVLLLNHQNSNMVLGSHHNILNLLFLPLLPLSSVTKHYLNSFKNRNRAESTFSIQMSLFKLTVIVVKITPSSGNRGKQRGYSSQEYDNCCILLEESQQKHLQVCMLQLTWTLHFIQHLSKAHSHVSRHFRQHSNESLQNKDQI